MQYIYDDMRTTLSNLNLLKMGKYVITTRKNGEFQFVLKSTNGRTILVSEGYKTKANTNKGIESVRKHAHATAKFDLFTAKNGQYYFNVRASNGQIIGSSEGYNSLSSRSKGMNSVRQNAAEASVVDLTVEKTVSKAAAPKAKAKPMAKAKSAVKAVTEKTSKKK